MKSGVAKIGRKKKINELGIVSNTIWLVILTIYALICVLPLVLVFIVSFSSEQSIFQNGYSFFPSELSLEGYQYFLKQGGQVLRSYGISIFVTVFGTLFSLIVTTMFAYVLSRPNYRYQKILTVLLIFTMLFNGGIVPSYMINTQLLGLRDSIWVLILPMSLNAFYVIILRTFLRGIPQEIMEAAYIDGAGEFKTFFKIMLPLSKPGIATIGMLTVIDYWNDWFYGMMYMFDSANYPIQTLLQSIQNSMEAINSMAGNSMELAQMASSTPTDSGRMALTVLVVVPVLLVYPFFQKYFVKGLTVGGVKG